MNLNLWQARLFVESVILDAVYAQAMDFMSRSARNVCSTRGGSSAKMSARRITMQMRQRKNAFSVIMSVGDVMDLALQIVMRAAIIRYMWYVKR